MCLFEGGDVELVANVTEEVQMLRNRVQLLEQVIHSSRTVYMLYYTDYKFCIYIFFNSGR